MLRPLLAVLIAAATIVVPAPAAAQLSGLGNTVNDLLGRTNSAVENATDAADNTVTTARDATVRELREARELQRDILRRRHRDVIDTDRAGELVVRSEVVAIAPTEAALEAARAAGFSVTRRDTHDALGLSIVTLRAPEGMSTRRAVERLREADPEGVYDFNHLYLGAGVTDAAPAPQQYQQRRESGGGSGGRIGMIDSGVDASHPALAGATIRQRAFGGAAMPATHGTAVASLLAGDAENFRGAAPGATLFVADVYGDAPTGGGATAIVAALAWLAEQRTPVVNMSLVGPPNRALEAGVGAMIARGVIIVAAVGNDGPSAPPLYPASYPGVVGVTGVDARDRVLPEAGRGAQVDLAAPGSDMAAAAPGGGYQRVRGTSFASPIVAGLISRGLAAPNAEAARRAETALSQSAADLGARGPDTTYGAGVVGRDLRVAPQVVAARR